MIIDCHTHFGRGILLFDVFQIDCTEERLMYLMDKGGVDLSVVFPVTYKCYKEANREIAELVNRNKRFLGFCRVVASAPDVAEQIEYNIKELGLRGVKMHTMDGPLTREALDKINELKVPALFHSGLGTSPIKFEGVIKSYPDMTIILAHLGFDLDFEKMFGSALEAFYLARKYKNVHLDTSVATWVQYFLEQAMEEVGPDKILFGTDAPWFYPAISKACIYDLEISDADKAKIMGGNIARILNL